MARLQEKYQKEIISQLKEELLIKNTMAVPKVVKIVVNMGIGKAIKNKELEKSLANDLATITGQKPSVRLAKVSVASFGLREGMPIGLTVTLRGQRMYSFLDKLISIILPRLRDFRGISKKSFDRMGNYSFGLTEHTIFPEIDPTKSGFSHGLEITIVTNTKSRIKSEKLLELLGMPFEKESNTDSKNSINIKRKENA